VSEKKIGGAGLRGQSAGETSICTVGVSGSGLTYRGYDVVDLAENTTFEEVAYLLLHEKLPNSQELKAYIEKLKSLRGLQPELRSTLEGIPKTAHPMDVLATGISFLIMEKELIQRQMMILLAVIFYIFCTVKSLVNSSNK
jgi:2-methylcitrate synthase